MNLDTLLTLRNFYIKDGLLTFKFDTYNISTGIVNLKCINDPVLTRVVHIQELKDCIGTIYKVKKINKEDTFEGVILSKSRRVGSWWNTATVLTHMSHTGIIVQDPSSTATLTPFTPNQYK